MKIKLYSENKSLQVTVFMNKIKEDENRINYAVVTPSSQEGYVNVALKDLNWFKDRGEPIADVLRNIVYDDLIAEITHFFLHQVPITQRVPRQFAKRGIGTFVLKTLMQDLSYREDIRHFYVLNTSAAFYNLLLNQRFRSS